MTDDGRAITCALCGQGAYPCETVYRGGRGWMCPDCWTDWLRELGAVGIADAMDVETRVLT